MPSDSQRLMLFDLKTQKWAELANLYAGYPQFSHDGRNVYFKGSSSEGGQSGIFRVRISDHRVEEVANLGSVRSAYGLYGNWMGLAPDDSPIVVRDVGTQDIYALDVQWP